MTFEEFYKDRYPDLNPEDDDFCDDLKSFWDVAYFTAYDQEAYNQGWSDGYLEGYKDATFPSD